MPARRSLPDYPNLRYLKVEAQGRTRSGELAALHEAQLAIAREHGLPGWSALCRMPAQSWVLPHVRWLISRFRDAGEPGGRPPMTAKRGSTSAANSWTWSRCSNYLRSSPAMPPGSAKNSSC